MNGVVLNSNEIVDSVKGIKVYRCLNFFGFLNYTTY